MKPKQPKKRVQFLDNFGEFTKLGKHYVSISITNSAKTHGDINITENLLTHDIFIMILDTYLLNRSFKNKPKDSVGILGNNSEVECDVALSS